MAEILTDRIERSIDVRAPRARVWRALSDPAEFAEWFGIAVSGPFQPGARLRGTFIGTSVDEEVARAQKEHAGMSFDLVIERVDPERRLAFRWHPGAPEPGVDNTAEPMTLVEFVLDDTGEGTRVTVVESGFDRIPLARRAKAFDGNSEGWRIMMGVLQKHLAGGS